MNSSPAAQPVPSPRAAVRALNRFSVLRDRRLTDLYCVLQACHQRLGEGRPGTQERAYRAIKRYLEDPATPVGIPTRSAYDQWRSADPERREVLPSGRSIERALEGWAGVHVAFQENPPDFDPTTRRMFASGPAPHASPDQLLAVLDVWLERRNESPPLRKRDFELFLEDQQSDPDPRLEIVPRSFYPFRYRFGDWNGVLAKRGLTRNG